MYQYAMCFERTVTSFANTDQCKRTEPPFGLKDGGAFQLVSEVLGRNAPR